MYINICHITYIMLIYITLIYVRLKIYYIFKYASIYTCVMYTYYINICNIKCVIYLNIYLYIHI